MPYRHRMHIICLRVRREIFIRCILSSWTGHADHYNNIHISIAFTCMETICHDFEGSFGIPHEGEGASPSMCHLRNLCRRSRFAEGLTQFEGKLAPDGILATWVNTSALLWSTMSWKLRCFCWVSWNHSYQTLKEQARAHKCYYI